MKKLFSDKHYNVSKDTNQGDLKIKWLTLYDQHKHVQKYRRILYLQEKEEKFYLDYKTFQFSSNDWLSLNHDDASKFISLFKSLFPS